MQKRVSKIAALLKEEKHIVLTISALLNIVIASGLALNLYYKLSILNILTVLFFLIILNINYIYYRTSNKFKLWVNVILITGIMALWLLFYTGGIENAGLLWTYLFALLVFELKGPRNGLISSSILYSGIAALYILAYWGVFPVHHSPGFMLVFFLTSIGSCTLAYFYKLRNTIHEQKLNEANIKYKSLFNDLNIGVLMISRDLKILEANRRMKEWFPKINEQEQPHCFEILHPDNKGEICLECPVKHTFEDGNIHVLEQTKSTSEGLKHYRLVSTPMKNSTGEVHAVIETLEDITEQKIAENNLRESEEKFRALTENSNAGMFIFQEDKFLMVNEAFCRMVDYSREEILSMTHMEMIHPDHQKIVKERAHKRLRGENLPEKYEVKLYTKKGETIWVDLRVKAITLNGKTATIGTGFDITERKAANEALAESKEMYQLLTEFASDVIWVLNLNQQRFTYISPSIIHLRGLTAEEAMAESLEEALTPESRVIVNEAIRVNLQKFLHNPETIDYYLTEIQQPCKDGRIVWVEVSTKFRYNKSGEIEVVGVSRNTDERKQMEQDLLYHLDTQDLIFKASSILSSAVRENFSKKISETLQATGKFFDADRCYLFRYSEDGSHYYQAEEWCEEGVFHSYPQDTLMSFDDCPWWFNQIKTNQALIIPNINQMPAEAAAEKKLLLEQQIKSLICVPISIQKKTEGFFGLDFVKSRFTPSREQISTLQVLANIISEALEKNQAEVSLRQSEAESKKTAARYKAFIEASKTGAWEYNLLSRQFWFSSQYFKMLGLNPEDFSHLRNTETNSFFNQLIHPDDRDKVISTFRNYLEQPDGTYQLISRLRHANGHYLWILSRGEILPDESAMGERLLVGTNIDITEEKRQEEIILAKNKELESYLYITSHDLRSPLVNIQGFGSRLQKHTTELSNILGPLDLPESEKTTALNLLEKEIPKSLHFIFSSVSKMDSLIKGLLSISRTGRIKLSPVRVNMNKLMNKIISANKFQIDESNTEVTIEPLPDCYGDEELLNQLFSNLFDNALKYRKPNETLEVIIKGHCDSGQCVYSIIDNGLGISEYNTKKIWDVFYRVNPNAEAAGEGIGLNLAAKIVEKHQGKIWVESEPGKGSCFYIQLNQNNFPL